MNFPLLVVRLSTLQLTAVCPLPTAYFTRRRSWTFVDFSISFPSDLKTVQLYSALRTDIWRAIQNIYFIFSWKFSKKPGRISDPHDDETHQDTHIVKFLVVHVFPFLGSAFSVFQWQNNLAKKEFFCCTGFSIALINCIFWERLVES